MKQYLKVFCMTLLLPIMMGLQSVYAAGPDDLKGSVRDAAGPVAGASVLVTGTSIGTTTDADGNFTLSGVKPGATLQISFIGYHTLDYKWNGGPVNVTLMEDTEQLEELVVVGYGVQKKVNLTGSVSTVKGAELENRPIADASQLLQGMVPGLYVSNNDSGRPGSSGTITIRGQGNLSNTATPYILVDGVEMNLSDVNPNDIESISVLKDAASCAIYGARAAYGVILVTTKKGDEGKAKVDYRFNAGWTTPTVLPDMVNSYDFATYWNDGCRNTGSARLYSDAKMALLKQFCEDPTSVDPWQELSPTASMNPAFENSESGIGNTDYFDLHYKDWAFRQNHNLNVSGGNKSVQYFVSGGYYSEDGILNYADMGYKRYNLNGNLNAQVTKWFKLKANAKLMHSGQNTPFGDGGLSEGFYHSLARFRPTVHYMDPNGHFTELSMVPYLQSGTFTKNTLDRINTTIGAEINPVKNWYIFADYTYKYSGMEYEAENICPEIYAADGVTTSLGRRDELGMTKDGKYTRAMSNVRYQSMNVYTSYLLSINDAHNLTFMVGFQQEDNDYAYQKNTITGLYSTANPNVGMGSGDRTVQDTRTGWATRGFFGRINYDYKGRYLLELNGRYDGSSRFASENRWGFFPSASIGWNIHRENFMKNASAVSNLKLRASYGLLGNQAGAALYTFASTMSLSSGLGSYIFADGRSAYTLAPGVVDPSTTWEKVKNINAGVDFGFFENALTGSFEVFQRETNDMLGPGLDFPDYFGASAPQTNNASMKNRGWEFAINWRGTIGKEVFYSIGGSIADATAEVTEYANPTGTNPSGNWYSGKKVGEIWGYRTEGLIQTDTEADVYNQAYDLSFISGKPWTAGDVKYVDLNGDGKINNGNNTLSNMGDMEVIGNTTPRYQYSFNGSISWKGLSLNFLFQGVGQRDWWPGTAPYFWGSGPYAQVTVFSQHMDYWTPENTDAYYPKPYIHTAGGVVPFRNKNMQTSDRYLQNAAYLRLKNLTISYNLPDKILKPLHLSKVQIYLSGENLLTFTKLSKMFDPEAIFTSNSYTSEGGKNYPMNKVLSCGLVINL